MSLSSPLVSICCITYNHENFIRQALDGFLMQQTNFPIEIIIHDDASTDNTANIIREYQGKHPHLIKPILQRENQYSAMGFGFISNVFKEAQGKYIALCEGDDYWTDPLKLQKQVDFLEENPEYSGAAHLTQVLEEDGSWGDPLKWWQDPRGQLDVTFEDTISSAPPFHTSSFLFRRDILNLPEDFCRYASGDMALYMLLSSQGKFRRIPEYMSIYRKHPGGITKTTSHGSGIIANLNRLYLYTSLRNYLFPKGYQEFNLVIKDYETRIVECMEKEEFTSFWANLAILHRKASFIVSLGILVKLGLFVIIHSLKNINLFIVFNLKRLIPKRLKNLVRSSMGFLLTRKLKPNE